MKIMSEQIDQLATALAKSQSEMDFATKNSKNPFFKSNYADFESIVSASRPSLTKYGLSVTQIPTTIIHENSDQISNISWLSTILMHSSGQWIRSDMPYNPPKSDVQSLSSYNTYLKRMCYTSIVGVVTSDDDDGEAAVAPTRSQPSYSQPQRPISEEMKYLNGFSEAAKEQILVRFKKNSLEEMTSLDVAIMKREIAEKQEKNKLTNQNINVS